ncbi:PD-(D/E)XK nuclease family protein [Anaerofustis sp. NSJ-163]|uniref:PD-(D/E)XK nuclease family protein n=1 Tax=Anaerofustis sp. NSJ-163 TaxID=2944391 RepID=UPI002111E97B|nr:PD-(D/E)XK nuclease family protein [Anaerofustis sp. NSJ-163]
MIRNLETNIFKILGVESKEIVMSRFFANCIKKDIRFLDMIAKEAYEDYEEIAGNEELDLEGIVVKTEYDFSDKIDDKGKKNKQNRVDIFITVNKKDGSKYAVYCIENKVYSLEGNKQTDRYVDLIDKNYGDYEHKYYIYLTADKSFYELTNKKFKRVYYWQLKKMDDSPLEEDFFDLFSKKNTEEVDKEHKKIISFDENKFEDYIEYLLKMINGYYPTFIQNDENIYACFGNYNGKKFCQISLRDLKFKSDLILEKKGDNGSNEDKEEKKLEFNIHLEVEEGKTFLHFETYPYFSKRTMESKYVNGENLYKKYQDIRKKIKNSKVIESLIDIINNSLKEDIIKFLVNEKNKLSDEVIIKLLDNDIKELSNVDLKREIADKLKVSTYNYRLTLVTFKIKDKEINYKLYFYFLIYVINYIKSKKEEINKIIQETEL